jgi:hypothetical protein
VSLVAYVAEDGLVGPINGRRDAWYCKDYMPHYKGMPGPGSRSRWVGGAGGRGGGEEIGDFWRGN